MIDPEKEVSYFVYEEEIDKTYVVEDDSSDAD